MKEYNENFYSLEELKRARDCYDGYQDGEEVFYFVGALRYACDEIDRLKNNWEELKQIIKNYKYTNTCHCYSCNKELCDILLDKMKELEENDSN